MPRTYFQMISTPLHFPEKINDNNNEYEDIKNFYSRIKILQFLKNLYKIFKSNIQLEIELL